MINLEMLGSLATRIHSDLRIVFYMLLPVLFGLSMAASWIRNPAGDPEYLHLIKRSFLAGILLSGFTEIANTICDLTNGLAGRISNMDGLENYVRMVYEKSATWPLSPMGMILATDDYFMGILSALSTFGLYIVKVLMLSVYQFGWLFLIIISPVLLAFHVLSSRFTLTLFQSLTEIACWKIVWAVLSAFLTAIPFGNHTAAEHGYATLIILNIIVIVAMIMTPLLTHALISGSFATVAATAGALATAQMIKTPARLDRLAAMMPARKNRTAAQMQTRQPALNNARLSLPPSQKLIGQPNGNLPRRPPNSAANQKTRRRRENTKTDFVAPHQLGSQAAKPTRPRVLKQLPPPQLRLPKPKKETSE